LSIRYFGENVLQARELANERWYEDLSLGNDAFAFMDAVVEWNYDRSNFDSVVDFHRFEAVFQRSKGW